MAEDVYEWLLLDAGHDDDELSRVSVNKGSDLRRTQQSRVQAS